jgi:hypothetical protein
MESQLKSPLGDDGIGNKGQCWRHWPRHLSRSHAYVLAGVSGPSEALTPNLTISAGPNVIS